MIICGFAGIGKSTLAKKKTSVIDLESTPFEKDWVRYAKVAKHMSDNGYIVLTSCHKEFREAMRHSGILYNCVIPEESCLEEYCARYTARGNSEEFISTIKENWSSWLNEIKASEGFYELGRQTVLEDEYTKIIEVFSR